jgi:hypothetical protein
MMYEAVGALAAGDAAEHRESGLRRPPRPALGAGRERFSRGFDATGRLIFSRRDQGTSRFKRPVAARHPLGKAVHASFPRAQRGLCRQVIIHRLTLRNDGLGLVARSLRRLKQASADTVPTRYQKLGQFL